MAPEVAAGRPYNHKADVFAWALVLWEMVAHEAPWSDLVHLSEPRFVQMCDAEKARPKLREPWPEELKTILTAAWSPEPSERPEMAEVVKSMQELFDAMLAANAEEAGRLSARTHNLAMRRILGPLGLKNPPPGSTTARSGATSARSAWTSHRSAASSAAPTGFIH